MLDNLFSIDQLSKNCDFEPSNASPYNKLSQYMQNQDLDAKF
jgi:hypothetical protein